MHIQVIMMGNRCYENFSLSFGGLEILFDFLKGEIVIEF